MCPVSGVCGTQVPQLVESPLSCRCDPDGYPPCPLGRDHCRGRCPEPGLFNSAERSENPAFPGENEDTGFLHLSFCRYVYI